MIAKANNNIGNRFDGDNKKRLWITTEFYSRDGIEIPIGFRYDKASVPRLLWSIIPEDGLYCNAVVIHDYLYQRKGKINDHFIMSKEQVDKLFLKHMLEDGVTQRRAKLMYWAVDKFGWIKWNKKNNITK